MDIGIFNRSREAFDQMREIEEFHPEIKEIIEENHYMFEKNQEKLEKLNDDHPAKRIFLKELPTLAWMNVSRDF